MAGHFAHPLTEAQVDKRIHAARRKLADFVVDEVAESLRHPTAAAVEEELRDLELLDFDHVRGALRRWSML